MHVTLVFSALLVLVASVLVQGAAAAEPAPQLEPRVSNTATVNVIERAAPVEPAKRAFVKSPKMIRLPRVVDADAASTLETRDSATHDASDAAPLHKRQVFVSCFMSCMNDFDQCGRKTSMLSVSESDTALPTPKKLVRLEMEQYTTYRNCLAHNRLEPNTPWAKCDETIKEISILHGVDAEKGYTSVYFPKTKLHG